MFADTPKEALEKAEGIGRPLTLRTTPVPRWYQYVVEIKERGEEDGSQ